MPNLTSPPWRRDSNPRASGITGAVQTATDLYYEVVNNRLCIKLHADSKDGPTLRRVRKKVRDAAHAVLDEKFELVDAGRLGAYMTACQIEHDFSLLAHMDKSIEVFAGVGRSLALIADRLRSAK